MLYSYYREDTPTEADQLAFCRLLAILLSLVLDTAFYQTPTFTPLRFLSTNVFHSISLFYGQNPWHFYLFQAIPLLLLTQLPFFLDGLRKFYTSSRSDLKNKSAMSELGWTAAGTTLSFSLLSHKEWRFLHPILPILHLFVSLALVTASRSNVPQTPSHDKRSIPLGPFRRFAAKVRIRSSHLAILLVSLLPALYLSAYHTKGQNDVMIWLRDEMRSQLVGSKRTKDDGSRRIESVGFVMPCHSTPWQSHLHSKELEMSDVSEGNGSGEGGLIWFIGCEPPVLFVSLLSPSSRSPLTDDAYSPTPGDSLPIHIVINLIISMHHPLPISSIVSLLMSTLLFLLPLSLLQILSLFLPQVRRY